MAFRRLGFSVLLGACLLPFAGYLGALMVPSGIHLWFVALLVALVSLNLKFLVALLLAPSAFGAVYAWPVMTVALPLAFCIQRRARSWAPFYGAIIGAGAGLLSVRWQGQWDLASSAGFAGLILGAGFGYAMWRFDRRLPLSENGSGPHFPGDRKLALTLSGLFIVLGVVYLGSLQGGDPAKGTMQGCHERGEKLKPEENSFTRATTFVCVDSKQELR